MSQDPHLISYLLLLRFGPVKDPSKLTPRLNYASIAKVVKMQPESCRRLIARGLDDLRRKQSQQKPARSKLSQEHIQFLCSQQTLTAWAHLSLQQRVVMFHRQFPELRISTYLLHATYKRHGITFKFIRRGKKVIDFADPHYRELFTQMFQAIKSARHQDLKLFWVDEAVFTFNTFRKRAFSRRRESITINDADYFIKAQALICAVSEDGGLEAFQIYEKAVTSVDFANFMHILAERAGNKSFAVFMDNLRVHKTLEVTETCKQLHAKPIYNVPYSPNFNGIENYFNLVKAEYKKLILQKLVKGIKPDVTATIHQSIANVQKEKV
jgi:transposase